MKIFRFIILIMFLLALAACGGDDPTATPFVIQEPATEVPQQPATAVPPTREAPQVEELPPTETALPVETATPTPTSTPTSTIVVATVPADETPLAPGIKATPNINDPNIAATVLPILTAFPNLGLDDIDLDALPKLPDGFELPPLPSLPGG